MATLWQCVFARTLVAIINKWTLCRGPGQPAWLINKLYHYDGKLMRMRQKLKATSRVLLDNREANIADIADRTARWFFLLSTVSTTSGYPNFHLANNNKLACFCVVTLGNTDSTSYIFCNNAITQVWSMGFYLFNFVNLITITEKISAN